MQFLNIIEKAIRITIASILQQATLRVRMCCSQMQIRSTFLVLKMLFLLHERQVEHLLVGIVTETSEMLTYLINQLLGLHHSLLQQRTIMITMINGDEDKQFADVVC